MPRHEKPKKCTETPSDGKLMSQPDKSNTIIIIPARMQSARLPGKPLANIAGVPMIVQVWRRAMEAEIGPVLVAAAEDVIAAAIQKVGGDVILTDADLPSGSDRIAQALAMRDKTKIFEYIINLQGDLPTIEPAAIRRCLEPLANEKVDISTLASDIESEEEAENENVVKVIAPLENEAGMGFASDFIRKIPANMEWPTWHHIGVYGYRRTILEKFVTLPMSQREKSRRLEQMRALDNDMRIAVAKVESVPFGVDTQDDLERARAILQG